MKRTITILAVATLVIGIATIPAAFARGMYGGGYGYHMDGYGHGHHWGRGDGRGGNGLSGEQREAVEAERDRFFQETRQLRNDMDEKTDAIREEFARENPDEGMLRGLQKELTGLRTEFDQKRLDHELKLRKIAPEYGRQSARGGRGEYGPGACWRE